MTTKSDNEKKVAAKKSAVITKDTSEKDISKSKSGDDDDDDDLDDVEEPKKSTSKSKASKKKSLDDEDDDDEDVAEIEDDWEKPEEGDGWDPDFDEFDVPKSKGKKAGAKKTEEDDLKMDDDFKEFGLFEDMDGGGLDDDDDF